MRSNRNHWMGIVLLLAGMTLFGSATPVSKLVGEGLPVFTASLLRVLLGALSLYPFVASGLPERIRSLSARDWWYLSVIAVFGMVGFTVFLIYGMKFISGVAGSIVMSFTPALTALAAFLFMGSAMDWRRGLAVALGVAGNVDPFVPAAGAAGFQASGLRRCRAHYLGRPALVGYRYARCRLGNLVLGGRESGRHHRRRIHGRDAAERPAPVVFSAGRGLPGDPPAGHRHGSRLGGPDELGTCRGDGRKRRGRGRARKH